MKKKMIKILIADDHDIIRQGLKRIIGFEDDMKIVAEAEDGEQALKFIRLNNPDIVLLDCNMPLMNGIDVLKKIKECEYDVKIIILTVENDRNIIRSAIDIGADGYILKDSAGTEIVNAIRMVNMGEKYIDSSLVSLLFSAIKSESKKSACILDKLTKREVEVLSKISKGFSNKEIGEQLYLSEKTIKNYATNLFKKINVQDRVQATILAIQNNIDQYYKTKYEP
jgi:two-component system response regulator DegU